MGQGSKAYFFYYLFASLVYLIIMAIGFDYSATFTCSAMCPMLIPVSQPGMNAGLDYAQCLCYTSQGLMNATGYPMNSDLPGSDQNQVDRYNLISAVTQTGLNCYICSSKSDITVYEPCPEFDRCKIPGLLGFRPAQINSTMMCNTQPNPTAPRPFAAILQAPAVTGRAMVNILIYIMASLFAIQTVTSLIIAYAYFRFKDKFDSDWGKLTRSEIRLGYMAKFLPNISRIANLLALIFLAVASSFFFSDKVCQFDENDVGQVVFYPTLSGFLIAMIIVWLFFCFLGGCFHNTYPRDTSFYNPRFPEEPDQNIFVRLLCRGWCILTNFGP